MVLIHPKNYIHYLFSQFVIICPHNIIFSSQPLPKFYVYYSIFSHVKISDCICFFTFFQYIRKQSNCQEKTNYEISAKLIDNRGAESYPTSKYLVKVISPGIIESYGLYIIILLILIIISLILYLFYIYDECKEEKERIARETDEAKLRLNEIFSALREEVDELMELADKKPGLSESERRVKNKLQEALDISEEFINKEI